MTTKILGSSATVYCIYSEAILRDPEVRQKLFQIGNQETVMHVSLLRVDTHLPSCTCTHKGLAAQKRH